MFYEKNTKTAVRIEQLKFAPYDDTDFIVSYSQLHFENNEIWEFTFKIVKNEKRLIIYLLRETDGIKYFLLDERAIITDRKIRKEALKKRNTNLLYIKKITVLLVIKKW